ncbi:hypothetical protein [Actinomadura sp. KC216]|uniref:hypothetical protein n=1 Tax=Actinomadura sp. KC216 TaxID=2530370 RepID=UPI001A9EFCE3|nr:hypothetical protein [Actinomadura sp. KC216]
MSAPFEYPYFTNATLETETDPYIVVHLANKLAQSRIYTEEQVRQVAELWVTRKGNNALSAAISLAQHDFRRRYAAAIEAEDKVMLNASTSSAKTSPPTFGCMTS